MRGVGEGISPRDGSGGARYKILILNGSLDREVTSLSHAPYGAIDFIRAIVEACVSSFSSASNIPPLTEKVQAGEWKKYVTHVIHLVGEGTPRVEREELLGLGIDCVRVYGRKGKEGMVYDGVALGQALEAIIGKGEGKSRRNTLGMTGSV